MDAGAVARDCNDTRALTTTSARRLSLYIYTYTYIAAPFYLPSLSFIFFAPKSRRHCSGLSSLKELNHCIHCMATGAAYMQQRDIYIYVYMPIDTAVHFEFRCSQSPFVWSPDGNASCLLDIYTLVVFCVRTRACFDSADDCAIARAGLWRCGD